MDPSSFGPLHADMTGHAVVVTGASRGIGLASAHAFRASGAHVLGVDLRPSPELIDLVGRTDAIAADVADPEQVRCVVAEVIERYGRIDVVHGNAGINIPGRLHSLSVDDYRRVMAVCLDANVFFVQAAVPHMRGNGGVFVFTSSMCGVAATPRSPAYNMAKHALTGLVQSIAVDYGSQGIRAVAVVTGPTRTPMIDELWGDEGPLRDGLIETTAVDRLAEPEELARVVLFAALPDSGFITGGVLTVDGGATAGWTSLRRPMFGATAAAPA